MKNFNVRRPAKVKSLHVVQEKGNWNKRDHRRSEKELDVRRTTVARERMDIPELLRKRGGPARGTDRAHREDNGSELSKDLLFLCGAYAARL